MAKRGFVSLSLKEEVVKLIDTFIEDNELGFRDRAEVIAQAVREFVARQGQSVTDAELRRIIAGYLGEGTERRRNR